jgi:hypothetical protein
MHASKSHLHLTCMEEPGLLSLDHLIKPDRIRSKLWRAGCCLLPHATGPRPAFNMLHVFAIFSLAAAGLELRLFDSSSGVRHMAQFLGAPETHGTVSHIRTTVERAHN